MSSVRWESSRDQRVQWAFLNRPKANILDAEMIADLIKGLAGIRHDTAALVISSDGPSFSYGASVAEHRKGYVSSMLRDFHHLFHRLDQLSIPLIASLKGQCLGGGFELAMFCHFVFATPDCRLGQPEIKLGVFPPMASLLLPLRLPALCDRIILTGESMSAEEIAPHGLITQLENDPDLAAAKFCDDHLLSTSASSLRFTCKASRWQISRALNDQLPVLEDIYLSQLMETQDAVEGIEAFIEKRGPVWRHT